MKPTFRCSELNQLINCHGSPAVKARAPKRVGIDGVEGSAIHFETAWRLVKELGAHQPDGGLVRPPDVPIGYKIPAFSAWLVDYFFRIIKDEIPTEWALCVEEEWIWEFDRFFLKGHGDVFGISPNSNEAKGFDWKSGRIPVDAADVNWQVAGYMALISLLYEPESIEFTIAQPWNDEDDGFERISRVQLVGPECARNVSNLEAAVNAALDDPMTLETGPVQCKYCVGLSCPGIQALKDSMQLKLTPELLAGIRSTQDDSALVDLVLDAKTLEKPIDDVKNLLKERLEINPVLTGSSGVTARLKESSGGFNVVDPVGMFGWLKEQLPEPILAKALSYPGGKIKDAIAQALDIPKTGKAELTAKSVFEGGAAPFIKPTTKKELVFS